VHFLLDEEQNLGHWQTRMERKVAVAAALTATIAAMTVALVTTPEIHSAALTLLGEEGPLAGDGEDGELEALVHYRRGRAPIMSYRFSEFNLLLYNEDTSTLLFR
jgi:hypothetical protein